MRGILKYFEVGDKTSRTLPVKGQYGTEGQQGRIKVPTAQVLAACRMHLGTRKGRGQAQLISLPQSQVNESTASVLGHHHLELKQDSCELSWLANRSMVWGPHNLSR